MEFHGESLIVEVWRSLQYLFLYLHYKPYLYANEVKCVLVWRQFIKTSSAIWVRVIKFASFVGGLVEEKGFAPVSSFSTLYLFYRQYKHTGRERKGCKKFLLNFSLPLCVRDFCGIVEASKKGEGT